MKCCLKKMMKPLKIWTRSSLNNTVLWVHSTFETLIPNKTNQQTKPSLEEAPEIELKVLPAHLKYAYLGEGNSLPVIISAALSPNQE